MQKIVALITYFSMQCRKSFFRVAAFVFSIARLTLFQFCSPFLRYRGLSMVVPIGENRKAFQAKINSDAGRNRLFGNGNVLLASKNDKPLIPALLNGAGLYFPFDFPVQFHFQRSYFRNRYLVGNNFKSGLRIANGMQPFSPLEFWKTGSLTLLHSSKKNAGTKCPVF